MAPTIRTTITDQEGSIMRFHSSEVGRVGLEPTTNGL